MKSSYWQSGAGSATALWGRARALAPAVNADCRRPCLQVGPQGSPELAVKLE